MNLLRTIASYPNAHQPALNRIVDDRLEVFKGKIKKCAADFVLQAVAVFEYLAAE